MQAKDLIVLGSSRLLGKLYCGDLSVGGSAAFDGKITIPQIAITSTGDIAGSSDTTGTAPLLIGTATGKHLEIDSDEIHAKNNASTAGALYLNNNGGNVYLSGSGIYSASGGTFTASTFSGATGNITTINSNIISNNTTLTNRGNIYNLYGTIESDTIKSNKWDIVSTQNLGGNFYVCPTIIVTENSTVTISSVNGTTIVGTLVDTTNITSNSFGGHTWTNGSKIKITGKLTSGTTSYVLGTCDGTLTANMNTSANTINFSIQCNASTLPPASTTPYTMSGGTVMMYNVGGSNPVGIHMTSYGTNKYTYIDIYNGSNGTTPKARLGKLDGLGTVNNMSPQGYGIYTDNGYFQGTIVANGGKIGGYTIGESNLTKGDTQNASGSFWLTPEGQSTTMSSLNSTALTWAMTVGQNFGVTTAGGVYAISGKIGGWSIGSSSLYYNSATPGASSSALVLSKGTASTNSIGGSGTSSKTWMVSAGTGFGVTTSGVLYATGAHIGGEILAESGSIGGYSIGSDNLTKGSSRDASGSFYLTPNGVSMQMTNLDSSNQSWAMTIGQDFGVTTSGAIFSNNIDVSGGKIGNWTISQGNLIYNYNNNYCELSIDHLQVETNDYSFSVGVSEGVTYDDDAAIAELLLLDTHQELRLWPDTLLTDNDSNNDTFTIDTSKLIVETMDYTEFMKVIIRDNTLNIQSTPSDYNTDAPSLFFRSSAGETDSGRTYGLIRGGYTSGSSNQPRIAMQVYGHNLTSNQWSEQIEMTYYTEESSPRTVFRPRNTGGAYLGSSGYKWNTVFASTTSINSDLKHKDVIEDDMSYAKDFIMALKPIAYHRTDNGATGKRIHVGLGAQDVYDIQKQFGLENYTVSQAWRVDEDGVEAPYYGEEDVEDKDLSWSLNYTEIYTLLLKTVQDQQKEIDKLWKIINNGK